MSHDTHIEIKEEKYTVTDGNKKWSYGLMIVGLILTIIGYFTYHPSIEGLNLTADDLHQLVSKRFWGNLLIDSYFTFIIATCAIIFVVISQLANAAWYVAIRRIPEAMSTYMIIGAGLLLAIILVNFYVMHGGIYHWAHPGVMETDPLLAKKTWYLSQPFYLVRLILFTAFWIFCASQIRKNSRNEDLVGGVENFDKNFRISTVFLVVFGFTFSMFAWDIMMSIDAHWYSTIFTIYNFATGWVSALTVTYLLVWYLRGKGYLGIVTDEHQHDLGKFMFAFSVFWTYMWTAQFLLIWYANIPEEVVYYKERMFGSYQFNFYLNIVLNFVVPFFLFMMRDAKRNKKVGYFMGAALLFGHWNDCFLMVMPGAMDLPTTISEHNPTGSIEIPNQGIGFMEIGMLLFFAGLFLTVVMKALTKANLYPTRHPFIYESAMHDVGV